MAINTVSDSQVLRSDCDGDVLALIETARACDSSDENNAIYALANLETIHGSADVQVGVLAVRNPNIFACNEISHVADCDTLVQKCDVLWLICLRLRLQAAGLRSSEVDLLSLSDRVEKPVLEGIHVNLLGLASLLAREERCE